jgi:hypothetical protein
VGDREGQVRRLSLDVRKGLLAAPMAGILSLAAVHIPIATGGGAASAAAADQANCVAVLTSLYGPDPDLTVNEAVQFLLQRSAALGVPPGAECEAFLLGLLTP